MKRSIALFLMAGLLLTVTGCEKKETRYTAKLPSNPSTGYDWQAVSAEPTEEFPGGVTVNITYEANPASKGLLGAPGVDVITFTGTKAGKATVTLVYVQPWEWDGDVATAEGTAVYNFDVDADLSLAFETSSQALPAVFSDFVLPE